jgi:RNA polymerase sigma-70 factor (ECF subfamily)
MAEIVPQIPELLERVQGGDEDAAARLVRELYPLVIRVVRRHRPRRLDEEDLAQMVFVRVFQHLEQFSGRVPFEHWVSRVAVNVCLNALRAERVRPELRHADLSEEQVHLLDSLATTQAAEGPAEQAAARELVANCLDSLAPADRLVMTMLELEGRSVREVCEATGWSASLVKVRAFRLRRKLRRLCEKWAGKTGAL